MRLFRNLSILAVLMLTACNRGTAPQAAAPESPAAPPATPPAAAAPATLPAAAQPPLSSDPRPRLVCFGDSLTAGYGTDPGQSYPDYLQAELDSAGYHYRVVNMGISGNTTKDGLERVRDVLALNPAVVVVEFGGNDGLRGLPIATTRANLDQIVAALLAAHTRVALAGITLPPDYGPDYIASFNQTYTLLARKYHVPLLPFLLQGVFGTPGMMQADNTHATAAGNQIVAHNVVPLVRPLLHHEQRPGAAKPR
ncbi:MAG: arylesterase [Acidobacteriota bacterium]|nr:arylesterase [Acidobacteriota bacterium]